MATITELADKLELQERLVNTHHQLLKEITTTMLSLADSLAEIRGTLHDIEDRLRTRGLD